MGQIYTLGVRYSLKSDLTVMPDFVPANGIGSRRDAVLGEVVGGLRAHVPRRSRCNPEQNERLVRQRNVPGRDDEVAVEDHLQYAARALVRGGGGGIAATVVAS